VNVEESGAEVNEAHTEAEESWAEIQELHLNVEELWAKIKPLGSKMIQLSDRRRVGGLLMVY
jgi:uncharacterized coiled-coil DUF342 family protein